VPSTAFARSTQARLGRNAGGDRTGQHDIGRHDTGYRGARTPGPDFVPGAGSGTYEWDVALRRAAAARAGSTGLKWIPPPSSAAAT
jgi:hypothetical protein